MNHLKYRLNIARGLYLAIIGKRKLNVNFWSPVLNVFEYDCLIDAMIKINNRFPLEAKK